jgi:hypothetical protein
MTGERTPAVAGQFYAADPEALAGQVEDTFTHPLGPGSIPSVGTGAVEADGLVSPHAGLPYSGPVAAHGYAHVAKQGRPDVVVAIGPNHSGLGDPIAVSGTDRWRTPLGTVDVHAELRDRLVAASALTSVDETAHQREHSIEVQLPFLQALYEDPPAIVPIVMGHQDREHVSDLADALATVISAADDSVLIVASTDLTHYEPQQVAETRDANVLERIEALDATGLLDVVERESLSMCGYGPTASMLDAASTLGATSGRTLQYATSGDVAGPADEVVGYCSAVVE